MHQPDKHDMIDPFRRTPIDVVARIVCDRYKASVNDITRPGRSSTVAHIRMIVMYLSNTLFKLTPYQISAFFRNDRSTVVYGIKRVERLVKADENLRHDLDELKVSIVQALERV